MHALIWTLGGQKFAVPSAAIVEVIPVVQTSPLPHPVPGIQGIFNYRGNWIPLIDAASMLGQPPFSLTMAARILVIDSDNARIGLLVQQVLASEPLDVANDKWSQRSADNPEFLGATVLSPAGPVHFIVPGGLPGLNIETSVSHPEGIPQAE